MRNHLRNPRILFTATISKFLTQPLTGNVKSPNSGQPVILAEKCEENSYTLIEPKPQQPDRLSAVNGHSQPPRGSNSSAEEMAQMSKNCAVSCETNSYREVSPSIEPFIPERV